jgi:hypothetical protein
VQAVQAVQNCFAKDRYRCILAFPGSPRGIGIQVKNGRGRVCGVVTAVRMGRLGALIGANGMDTTTYPYQKSRLTVRCLIRVLAFVVPIVMLAPRPAKADLIITATNLSVLPGGTGIMNFYVSSDSADTLSDFTLELLASPVAGPEGVLEFTADQPAYPYSNPTYVFYGESTDDYYAPDPSGVLLPPVPLITLPA